MAKHSKPSKSARTAASIRTYLTVGVTAGVTSAAMAGLGTLALTHTEVPQQLEGRGIASALVKAAFAHAKENGMDVLPVCSYVRAWVQRHPEVAPQLAENA